MGIRFNKIKESDMFSHLTSFGYLPRWTVLLVDCILCALSFLAAYYLSMKYLYNIPKNVEVPFETRLLLLLIVQIIFFWVFHTYSGILRYSSVVDLMKIVFAVSATVVVLLITNAIWNHYYFESLFLISGLISYGVIALLLLFFVRLIIKTFYDTFVLDAGKVLPVMVYGTKQVGISLGSAIQANSHEQYKLVGFLNDEEPTAKRILGRSILTMQEPANVLKFIAKNHVKAIVISPLKLKELENLDRIDFFISNGIKVLKPSSLDVLEENQLKDSEPKKLKSIEIEDLLNRSQIEIDVEIISQDILNKVVLITGAAGSIGSEIVRQVCALSPKLLVLVDNAETPMHNLHLELKKQFSSNMIASVLCDVRNRERMKKVIADYRPDYIFHAAAYKHVPLMEDNPSESIITNVLGTKILADLAVAYGVKKFVMISTDKAVNPTNVMGASKRIAEIYVQSLFRKQRLSANGSTTNFITTRFGNVLGSNGSVIPLFKRQIEQGGPLTVTHPDIIRYFMTISEACKLVLEAGTLGHDGEIFIFDMGKPVRIADLAKRMIVLAGLEPDKDIKIVYTGLRAGEKLYEELLNTRESTLPTSHGKVMIAKVNEYDYDTVSPMIDELIEIARESKDFLVVSHMKRIVPEFISNNSVYESLDIKTELSRRIPQELNSETPKS